MNQEQVVEKLSKMREKFLADDTKTYEDYSDKIVTRKMNRIKKKLLLLEMERCQRKLDHKDLSAIDRKIEKQKSLFAACSEKK